MRISDWKIGTRLAIGFAVMLLLMSSITGIAIWRLSAVARLTRETLQVPLEKERLVSDWYRLVAMGARRSLAIARSSDATLADFFAADVKETSGLSLRKRDAIKALLQTPQERAVFDELTAHQEINRESRARLFQARTAGDVAQAERLMQQVYMPNLKDYQAAMERFQALQRANIDASARRIDEIYADSRDWILALGALGLVCCTVFVAWLTRSITGPLRSAVAMAQAVARGQLGARIDVRSQDESGQLLAALGDMTGKLAASVRRVRAGTAAIVEASTEIAAGSVDLSSRTEEQAGSLEETAASMEELTATVRENEARAHQASDLAGAACTVAQEGGAIVTQVVATMAAIDESSRRIADITSLINGLAFQTNILALNAAVEAARAGDQGRGFAVVAAEVRALAQRCAGAAREIAALIAESARGIEDGNRLVGQAGEAMTRIVESSRRVSGIMHAIADGSREQSAGIEQINQAMAQMEHVTQQNAALVEQAAASSQSMRERATEVAQAVQAFRLDGEPAPGRPDLRHAVAAIDGPRLIPA